jgi:hypothetical protein
MESPDDDLLPRMSLLLSPKSTDYEEEPGMSKLVSDPGEGFSL